ncbi:PAS domain S-box protein [Bermanella marisrubri]|uniref:histidine kinase n=1 Tax=Bermanella marisrubri TaxID=207949 RepID=Q1N0Z7_9GAMM|nr:sensor histidine kinase [Bermanella marisrubri]EAT11877.1 probable two-component sensor [Oceanobacter sp. RED65] [Bermanella marisrubri]QIZ83045.1 PAS domain S-box protein [Bermanella marisrubri]
MSFSLSALIAIILAYLFTLFFTAYAVEKNWIPSKWVRNPFIYVLSLGVYASAWAFYGSVGLAQQYGYGYLTYYLGISGAFVLAPVLLKPILRITRNYQLTSLADLFAFRFRSRAAGTVTTLVMLAAILPLITLQITAVTESFRLLNNEFGRIDIALGYCFVMTVFAILFGARHVSPREKHESLVFAIAFESIIKLVAICILGFVALYSVFDGPAAMDAWLDNNHMRLSSMQDPIQEGPWRTLLMVFFAAAVVMPHMFHMAFTENSSSRSLIHASWGLPLFLLIMAIMVPPILWAGVFLDVQTPAEYYAIGIGMALDDPWLSAIAFTGGLAAASGIVIVTTLAMAAMTLNHIVLPAFQPNPKKDMYDWLLWVRRWLIAAIFIASYGFYRYLSADKGLAELGIIAFVATLQFLPGVLGVLYWPGANRQGFLSGLMVGIFIWIWAMLLPLLDFQSLSWLDQLLPPTNHENWYLAATLSVLANFIVFVMVSITSTTRPIEESAAEACSIDTLSAPQRKELVAKTAEEFIASLSEPLGEQAAKREVVQALKDLNLNISENRPYQLRRLRSRIEINLSGLMGPSVAHSLVSKWLPFKYSSELQASHDIHFIEKGLEAYHSRLTGLAAELDSLRRFHRQTLERLPMGACSLGADGEILMWNSALAEQSGISAEEVVGSKVSNLVEPLRSLLLDFIEDDNTHLHKKAIEVEGRPRWISLHKGALENPDSHEYGGLVILLEDQTDTQLLEEELVHSERLASVGRLAAGVAHEIGNPITGIAMLAQDLKYESDDPTIHEIGEQVLEQTQRVSRIVQSLVNFSHTGNHLQHQEQGPVDIRQCAQDAIDLLKLSEKEQGVMFENHCPDDAIVLGDEQRLQQVFVNLLSNARDASPDNTCINVSAELEQHTVTIRVVDEGEGIAPEKIERIFEPFFTTKEVGKGTGLGLALVYSIIEEHYGQISIQSPVDKTTQTGTAVIINLPRFQLTANDEPETQVSDQEE